MLSELTRLRDVQDRMGRSEYPATDCGALIPAGISGETNEGKAASHVQEEFHTLCV
jgi:hypothetical protein